MYFEPYYDCFIHQTPKYAIHEITKAVISEFLQTLDELKEAEFISNVSVIFFGSAVSELRKPSDLDILVVCDTDADKYHANITQYMETLSPNSTCYRWCFD